MSKLRLFIDGCEVEAEKGMTILEAAREAGIYIPSLCSHPDLSASRDVKPSEVVYRNKQAVKNDHSATEFEGCQLCVVEIEGKDELPFSCIEEVTDGMVVHTNTAKVQEKRRENLVRIIIDHPHLCLDCDRLKRCQPYDICLRSVEVTPRCVLCPSNGNCELQKVTDYIGLGEIKYPDKVKGMPVDLETPLFDRDYNYCIGCLRCVRACRDLRGVDALGFVFKDGRVVVGSREPTFSESACASCGACAEVCPTGAMTDKSIKPDEREEKLVPCQNACPAGIDVPRYIRLIKEGKYAESLAVIREKVPFPATLGRVCLHFCENVCRHSELNEPIAIRILKRYAAENDTGLWKKKSKKAKQTGKKVAVIGAGPAGLAAAFYLAKKGHKTTVFESLPVAGGMLRVGIPYYRLPSEVLDAEIEEIKNAGVKIKTDTRVDSLAKLLKDGYDAVLLATGAHQGIKLSIPGSDMEGILINTDFLRDVRLGKKIDIGKKVVVLGGGNVAFDCARTSVRLGAKEVHIACLEPRDGMLATPEEIEEGEEEGIIVHPSQTFVRVVGDNGHASGIECLDVTSFAFDKNGRLNLETVPDSQHIIPADTIIFAVGQVPDLKFAEDIDDIKQARRRVVVNPDTLATDKEGIFAAGDNVTGTTSVIEAIAAGRKAASSIDRYLGGDGNIEETLVDTDTPSQYIGREEGFADKQRVNIPILSTTKRSHDFTVVELGYDKKKAHEEAKRCLQCDLRCGISSTPLPPQTEAIPAPELIGTAEKSK